MKQHLKKNNPLYILSSPHLLTIMSYLPIFAIYLLMPYDLFYISYNALKVSNPWSITYYAFLLVLFGLGGFIGSHLVSNTNCMSIKYSGVVVPRWYVRSGLVAALFAYVVWFSLGVLRANGVRNLISMWFVDPFYVKSVLLETVPGITTLTQVAVAAVPVMICCVRVNRCDYVLSGLVFLLAIIRAFLFGERLALLELLVPILYIKLITRKISWRSALAGILFFIIFVAGFFILTEVRRSFVYTGSDSVKYLIQTGTVRFLGYYMTSINNGIFFIQHYAFAAPLYNTFVSLWRFPGLHNLYNLFTCLDVIDVGNVLYKFGLNPEFNTLTYVAYWVIDFGLCGALIVSFFFGFLSGIFYKLASQNSLSTALYSIWLVGLLEFMRICYFTSTRLFPAYIFFIGALILSRKSFNLNEFEVKKQ